MSLQVWLPLIKDTNNYGLSITSGIISNSLISYDNGKLGKSIRIANYQSTTATYSGINNITKWSICCWLKINSSDTFTNYNDFFIIGMNNDGATSGGFRIEHTNTAGAFQIPVPKNVGLTNNNSWYTFYSNGIAAKDNWCHIIVVNNGINYLTYINGNLVSTVPISNFTTTTSKLIGTITLGMSGSYCWLNDLRIYDHALSVKEVKEIAKGLVLHYPLNCNGIGIPNLVDNSATFSGWTAGSGWTLGEIDRIKTYSFSRTGATSNNWVRLIPTLQVNGNDYPNGITVSMDIYTPDKSAINQRCFGSLQTYQASGSRIGWVEPQWDVSKIINNQWCRISYTFTQAQLLNNNTSGTTYAYTKFSFQLVQNGNISIRKIKIEEGNKATTWIPNEFDPLYAAAGYASGIVYDCSGYQNNGTEVGTITGSSDTPRYRACSNFPSGANYINAGRGAMVTDAITVNTWIKYSTWGTPVSCTEGGGWNFENNNVGIRFPIYTTDNTYRIAQTSITPSSLANNWHMLTGTYDGENVKIYIDGKEEGTLAASTSHKNIKYNVNNVIFIGAEAGGNATTPASTAFIGNISDFRIYCTALSADDIKALYEDAGYIDKNGNFHAYEFVEE